MCVLWRHRWNQWEKIEEGKIIRQTDADKILGHKPAVVGAYEYQRRTCLMCGKSQLREVTA